MHAQSPPPTATSQPLTATSHPLSPSSPPIEVTLTLTVAGSVSSRRSLASSSRRLPPPTPHRRNSPLSLSRSLVTGSPQKCIIACLSPIPWRTSSSLRRTSSSPLTQLRRTSPSPPDPTEAAASHQSLFAIASGPPRHQSLYPGPQRIQGPRYSSQGWGGDRDSAKGICGG
ncbi:lysine-rich arabinogalactan protein 19-like [Arachis ipaensis]|uniref:lysine-rich arabinogalactan protein 19-like n=1 Tax=Arachis ipaensis TaxID=130454 RepID=UPI0007AF4153|nr:lysine-rich arabinogalactan protein 19-like [Arachis ipaensis]